MAWFADLAGKAENLLNNLDEQTGAALRNHNVTRKRIEHRGADFGASHNNTETAWLPKKISPIRCPKKVMPIPDTTKIYIPNSQHQSRAHVKENPDSSRNGSVKSKKSPTKKSTPMRQYNLDHCPKTLVRDVKVKDKDRDSNVHVDHLTHTLKLRSKLKFIYYLIYNIISLRSSGIRKKRHKAL